MAAKSSGGLDELDAHRLQGLVDGLVEMIRRVVDADVLDGAFEELLLFLVLVTMVTTRNQTLTDELEQSCSRGLFRPRDPSPRVTATIVERGMSRVASGA